MKKLNLYVQSLRPPSVVTQKTRMSLSDIAEIQVLTEKAFRLAAASLPRLASVDEVVTKGKRLLRLSLLCLPTHALFSNIDDVDEEIKLNDSCCRAEALWYLANEPVTAEKYAEAMRRLERKHAMLVNGKFSKTCCAMCACEGGVRVACPCGALLCGSVCLRDHRARGHEALLMETMRVQ